MQNLIKCLRKTLKTGPRKLKTAGAKLALAGAKATRFDWQKTAFWQKIVSACSEKVKKTMQITANMQTHVFKQLRIYCKKWMVSFENLKNESRNFDKTLCFISQDSRRNTSGPRRLAHWIPTWLRIITAKKHRIGWKMKLHCQWFNEYHIEFDCKNTAKKTPVRFSPLMPNEINLTKVL